MPTKVIMPELGEGVTDATITAWLKKEGDEVAEYDALVEVNTDKVDTEIPSPVSGTLLKVMHTDGATIAVHTILAWIGEPGEEIPEDGTGDEKVATPQAAAAKPMSAHTPPAAMQLTHSKAASSATGGKISGLISPLAAKVAADRNVNISQVQGTGSGGRITKEDVLAFVNAGNGKPAAAPVIPLPAEGARSTFISPVVGRLVGEHNINLLLVTGTGKDGRITKKDIETYIAAGKPAPATVPAKSAPPVPRSTSAVPGETMKLTPVRKSIADHMVRSVHTSAHVITVFEADMSAVFSHRSANKTAFAQNGVNLTFTAYFVVAAAQALKEHPIVNSSWTEDGIAVHHDVNIGVAASLGEAGLIVPVIKGADNLSLSQVASSINDLAERARGKKLKVDEVQGGTFTITNHGVSGSLFATPIINQPQCAIFSTGMIQKRAVVINDAIAIRPMVYLGLTFDHRILDGVIADYFLASLVYSIENWK
ncbi:MAG: 2-oxo acid dehydrogenase subunit E2 [Chloroflexi bacterium]|nr:2-oxo acid dehydrogenase subunit E2 [Chloroflexota bacterium]